MPHAAHTQHSTTRAKPTHTRRAHIQGVEPGLTPHVRTTSEPLKRNCRCLWRSPGRLSRRAASVAHTGSVTSPTGSVASPTSSVASPTPPLSSVSPTPAPSPYYLRRSRSTCHTRVILRTPKRLVMLACVMAVSRSRHESVLPASVKGTAPRVLQKTSRRLQLTAMV